ncbi:MAG: tetratricopeptide repeat protein [Caldilineaceae bacterium]
MDVKAAAPTPCAGQPDDGFATLFAGYVQRNADVLLAQVAVPTAATVNTTEGADAIPDTGALSTETIERALHLLGLLLQRPAMWPTTRTLLLTLAPGMEQAGLRRRWLEILHEGIGLSQLAGDAASTGELEMHLGLLYQLLGEFAQAERAYAAALRCFETLAAAEAQARALNRLAHIAKLESRFTEASTLAERAAALLAPESAEWGFAHFVRGVIALEQRDFPTAISQLRLSLDSWRQYGSRRQLAWGYRNLGAALFQAREYDEAAECTRQAIAHLGEVGDGVQQAIAHMNLGAIHVEVGDMEASIEEYVRAESPLLRAHDILHLAMLYNNLGYTYCKQCIWSQAEQAYVHSISYWKKLHNTAALVNVMDGLAIVYSKSGKQTEAVTLFEQALALTDQIESAKSRQHYREMVARHLAEVHIKM